MSFRLAAQESMLEGETLEDKFAFARAHGFDGIELSGRGDGVFAARRDAVSIVEEVGSSAVSVIADTFHMSIEETDIGAAIRDAGAHIEHVQLGDSDRLEPGHGHYDWPETLDALEAIGYDGWLAMECRLSGPPAEVLPRVAELLRR